MPGTRQHRSAMTTKGHGTARNGDDSSTTAPNTTHPWPFCVLSHAIDVVLTARGVLLVDPATTPQDPRGDLGHEDRDDANVDGGRPQVTLPQWISVTRTETTAPP